MCVRVCILYTVCTNGSFSSARKRIKEHVDKDGDLEMTSQPFCAFVIALAMMFLSVSCNNRSS